MLLGLQGVGFRVRFGWAMLGFTLWSNGGCQRPEDGVAEPIRQPSARDGKNTMANTLLPIAERTLTPDEVEYTDRRRRRGQLYLVICFLFLIVGTLVTIWSGQDATYSPGWARPMVYWNAITFALAVFFGLAGLRLRRGSTEFFSY